MPKNTAPKTPKPQNGPTAFSRCKGIAHLKLHLLSSRQRNASSWQFFFYKIQQLPGRNLEFAADVFGVEDFFFHRIYLNEAILLNPTARKNFQPFPSRRREDIVDENPA